MMMNVPEILLTCRMAKSVVFREQVLVDRRNVVALGFENPDKKKEYRLSISLHIHNLQLRCLARV